MITSMQELICKASSSFLTEELHLNLKDEEDSLQWISTHRWQPLESDIYNDEEIYEMIVNSAEVWADFIKLHGGIIL